MAQAAPAPDPTVLIAQAFVQHYYTTFDNDRSKLVALYVCSWHLVFFNFARTSLYFCVM